MVHINKKLRDLIKKDGENSYNEECCGAIFGKRENGTFEITELLTFKNERGDNRKRRYLISPKQYLESERIASEKKLNLLGFYHSHPDHPAIPSQFDTEHALPYFVYIIVSVRNGKAERLTSWKLMEDRSKFEEMEMNII
jgi:proteasome lid subunit RPN8/RPN11